MTENNVAAETVTPAGETISIETVVARLEDAVAVDRPRRDLRLTDSITQDLRLDSLALLEVLTRVEEEFDIELIDTPETFTATTVGDLAALIRTKVGANDAGPGPDDRPVQGSDA